LPPLTRSYSDDEDDAVATAEERRHRDRLDRAWHAIETHPDGANGLAATIAGNINNASDLIKRKLLRENASPDKAVKFSNLYSRLLTQPVLGQKWAILYLLYRLSETASDEDRVAIEAERSRSPLMEDGNLENMLFKGMRNRLGARLGDDVDEGPAVSSSVSQRGSRSERVAPLKKTAERERRRTLSEEEQRKTREESVAKEAPTPSDHVPSPPVEAVVRTVSPPESTLLRDLPFVLQGLSTTNLEFSASSVLQLPATLPVPMISLLHTLAEPCLLYKDVLAFVDSSEGGLVSQALRAAIGGELRSYLSLVATLEGEIRRALAAAARGDAVRGAVTLKRCVVWVRDATMVLRLMSSMIGEAKSKCFH
jgi:gamma-tubulin complex component 3